MGLPCQVQATLFSILENKHNKEIKEQKNEKIYMYALRIYL